MLKKAAAFILKAIGVLALLIVLFVAGVYVVNVVSTQSEQAKIERYGQLVPVDGKQMNVVIEGNGPETIVLLPGFGTASPGIDFKPLVKELSPNYKVVVVEPFGYGLSDETDKERTSQNIVKEIHEALLQLHINRYILMGHSIAGIYSLEYVNQYPDEVSAFVGIDSSVPAQWKGAEDKLPTGAMAMLKKSGFSRLFMKLAPDPLDTAAYSGQDKEQNRLISLQQMSNPNILGEADHFESNFKHAMPLTYPKSLPLLLFVVKVNEDHPNWIVLHNEQIKDSVKGKVVELEGDHYLHHTRSKEIAEGVRAFLTSTEL